jgi:hypothetical protein
MRNTRQVMDANERLSQSISVRRTGLKADRTVRLGDVIVPVVENCVAQQLKYESVIGLWDRLLPANLRQHCKITDISDGQLKVAVDSSSYIYELQLCSSEILKELQKKCPRAHVKKIKLVAG